MIEGIRIVQIFDSPWRGIPGIGDWKTQTVKLMKVAKDDGCHIMAEGSYQFEFDGDHYRATEIPTLAAPRGDISSMKGLMAEVCKSRRLPVIRIDAREGIADLTDPITTQGKKNFRQNKNEAE